MKDNYDIKSIIEEIELELIKSMKRTLWSHKEDEKTKGFNWPQWQALKLKQFENYRKNNKDIFKDKYIIDKNSRQQIKRQFKEGASKTNKDAIKAGFIKKEDSQLSGSFFGLNHRKLDALIKSTNSDLKDVKYATLRMANDQYRKIIFKAEVYANTGAKTVKQAIDMATQEFLLKGFDCIEYKNGSRHNIADYCDMAIKTANKRANLMGEGEMRKKIGNPLVYISKHGGACDKCTPWEGRVYIDNVWSGGKEKDGKYPLLSTAIQGGLFHPRCQHGSSTYFEGINNEPEEVTNARQNHDKEDKYTQYLQRKQKQYKRLVAGSLLPENIIKYQNKVDELQSQIENVTIEHDKELTLEECKEIIENQNITFWNKDLSEIDNRLLSDNTKRLNQLIEKYPKTKEFIKNRNVKFNALDLKEKEIAHVSSDIDLKNIEITLSKKQYKSYNELLKTEANELKIKNCMDRTEKYKSVYTITHEFGHFIENIFIDEYNKQHLAEFFNMKSRALNAKTINQSKNILRKWQENIADEISQEIYGIALKNNPKLNINKLLSVYGKKDSFEFFAECFANLECGKPNELGKALSEYLKKRGL